MNRMRAAKYFELALAAMLVAAVAARGQKAAEPVMTLVVDETQAARRITFVHEEIRVRAGDVALAFPKWIPGEHGPTGPIQNMAALRVRSASGSLDWVRDPDDIFTIHVEVPAGTDRIFVDFDTLLENVASDHQVLVAWNTVVLYPRGIDKRELMIEPTIVLPPKWKQGSSLRVTSEDGARVKFAPVSLERLIDSPLLGAEFFRVLPLTSAWPAELDIAGDSQGAVDKADDLHAVELFSKLVDQDRAMFGFRHWQKLHLLVTQSDSRPFDGLEHEDSPYTGVADAGLSKKDQLQKFGWMLLAHEQSHSWDGKYRRPAELYSKPDYQGPERASLLWVYEGLNQYIGMLLATRTGFNDADYARDYLGRIAGDFTVEPGRATTPLVDTATQDWVLRPFDVSWYSLRRGQDYYDEGMLIWIGADAIIREKTQDKKSLDDFLREFFGQRDTEPLVVPYTREDVEKGLSAVCAYDWHNYFETRIYKVNSKPPTDGLEAAGWRLVYNATPNFDVFFSDLLPFSYDASYSIGLSVRKDGTIFDVRQGMPAWDAGLGPNMVILAVDGRAYSGDVLNESIAHPWNGKIVLQVRNFNSVETHEIRYAGGVRYPHLERIPGTHDYLSEMLETRSYKEH